MIKNRTSPVSGFGGATEDGWLFDRKFGQSIEKLGGMIAYFSIGGFVSFCKNQGKRALAQVEPFDKGEIAVLGFDAGINQSKDVL